MSKLFVSSFRLPASSSSLTACRPCLAGPSTFARRPFSLFSPSSERERHVLGRITPKRIAVPRSAIENGQFPGYTGTGAGAGAGAGEGFTDPSLPRRSIWRPLVFCGLLGGGGYALLALYTNQDTQKWADKLGGSSWWRKGQSQPSDREIQRAKQLEGARTAQKTLNTLPKTLSFLPNFLLIPVLRTYVMASEFYLNTPSAQLAPMGLIFFMSNVFVWWKLRRLEPSMRKWWLHRPIVFGRARDEWRNCVTMFTSTLSHQSLPHLAFNSLALFSFGSAAYSYLSSSPSSPSLVTSTHTPHFFAFLLTAGLFSSLGSHLWTNIFRYPILRKALSHPARISSPQALMSHQGILPSLGASGAIYAALTMTACAFPDSNVGIIFIPFVSLPIGMGVAGMITLDLIGLIRGWRMFDHVAHLSGALFGFVYYRFGREVWQWTREKLGAVPRGSGLF
ncbi:uncharacterized protein IL334_006952 [Kwoniella shivajii]|uniref:Peptidase S54 rhomboid domain-containing protein n=1 Tax=Kwoniella shivajii TaxID=564305 RepID=A0ABZ1D836_9TREE|nr:hypothetical protein IL334_006952 [Kwoniella shivajii]